MMSDSDTYLVTGSAGFVGFYLSKHLLEMGNKVVGIDNLNNYYDIKLKEHRLQILNHFSNFSFCKLDLVQKEDVMQVFEQRRPRYVFHMAAQAGVRYSIDNPDVYIQSNIVGTYNIFEACRYYPVQYLYYASSSSVYGANSSVPFRETDNVDNPVSLYAATKKSIELIAHTYTHLYNIPISGFRFFTVYGPMGRPDMAYYKFIDLFFSGKPIQIYNNGDYQNDLYRDFTYIDDIIEGIAKLHERTLINNTPKHLIYNIGNNNPIKLMDFIETLELCLGKSLKRHVKFSKEFLPIQSGDVLVTYASTERLENEINYKPHTSLSVGLQNFTDWYVDYYHKE